MRILRVVKKEYKEFVRDKGYLWTMIIVPLIIMIVFGYTFQLDIDNLDTIVLDEDNSEYSKTILDVIDSSDYFERINFEGNLSEAKVLLAKSEARAVFYIPEGFENELNQANKTDVKIFIDSSDYTVYNFIKGASGEVLKDSFQDIVRFIVEDLEEEREDKQKAIDEIQVLIDQVEENAETTLDKVSDLKKEMDIFDELIDDTERKMIDSKSEVRDMQLEVNSLVDDVEDSLSAMDTLSASLTQLKQMQSNLSVHIDPMLSEISSMKNEMGDSIDKMESLNPSSRVSFSTKHYNIDEFRIKLANNDDTTKEINATAHDLKQTYNDVQGRIDTVYLELKTLNKDFLSHPIDLEKQYLFDEISYFDYLTPAIMSLVLFFLGIVATIISVVEERKNNTLARIATTPLNKLEFLGGKFIVFLLAGLVEVVYIILIAKFLFNVNIAGSIFDVALVLLLLISASIGLGLLASTVVKTMKQAVMFLPAVVIPSILISQTFSPVEVMPRFMQYFAYISPMFYSNVALREIMIKGVSFAEVYVPILVLLGYAIITLLIGVLIYKKRIE